MTPNIAILTDSGTDVPPDFTAQHPIYTAPLHIHYDDGNSFADRVDITPDQVYESLEYTIPKTSTPTLLEVERTLDRIIADGYTHVIAVSIASGLSGTFDAVRLAAEKKPELTCAVVDSKNIGIGAGLIVMYAADLVAEGLPFATVVEKTEAIVPKTSVFFCVETLEYLFAGGRITKATYALGSVLNLRPIITCNTEGMYVPIAKARGRKKSLEKTVALAQKALGDSKHYRVAVAHGKAAEEAAAIAADTPSTFPLSQQLFEGQVTPSLVVHTGPGTIGIAVQRLD